MPAEEQPVYWVDTTSDPVVIKVHGRANYLNCAPISHFFDQMLAEGRRNFIVELSECTGMDSTFLGIIASTALELRKPTIQGHFILCHLSAKNEELVQNLGLPLILTLQKDCNAIPFKKLLFSLSQTPMDPDRPNAEIILKAHESLTQIDPSNLKKFQDVITFLKNQSNPPRP